MKMEMIFLSSGQMKVDTPCSVNIMNIAYEILKYIEL